MNVTCPACKTRYSVDDARVPPSGVTIKCPKCAHTFVAKPPRPREPVALPGAIAPPAPGSRPSAASGPAVPLPGRAADTGGAVPLPGSTGAPGSRSPPGGGAVPLPGSPVASGAVPLPGNVESRVADAPTNIGDLDLGLEDDIPLPAPKAPAGSFGAPAFGPPPTETPALGGDDALGFINDKAGLAQMGERSHNPELRIRRRNGRVEGPYGMGRIQAMLRNKELQGSEDISDDGVSWRAMSSQPELNATIVELASSNDQLGFGNVDLPISASTDLPIPSTLPKPKSFGLGSQPFDSLDFNSGDLATDDVAGHINPGSGDVPGSHRTPYSPTGGPASGPYSGAQAVPLTGQNPSGNLAGQFSPEQARMQTQGALSDDLSAQAGAFSGTANLPEDSSFDRVSRDLEQELEVGDVPELPPLWQTYRKHILAFAGAVAFVLLGVFTQFYTSVGAYGIPGLVELFSRDAPEPVPVAPPPPPATVADPKEVASLIDEHSYESFRSVFATVEQAGAQLADNQLALAKARGLATLAYGVEVFPLDSVTSAVANLNSIELSSAMGGDPAAANIAIAKGRSALQILAGEPDRAANQLAGLLEANPDDKELALLLGAARAALGKHDAAIAAYDRAIVADPTYAPALHAIGASVEAAGGPNATKDAAAWYVKALDANPNHSRSGLAAARLFKTAHDYGEYHRILKRTAPHVSRGLPTEQRPEFLYRVGIEFDEYERLPEVAAYVKEAARLQPANEAYVALGAVASALTDAPQEGLTMINGVLSRNPSNATALIARARVYAQMTEYAKGFIDLDKARQVAPNDARISLWEARLHTDLGKYNDAKKSLARAVRLAGTDALPHITKGRLELKTGDVDAAFDSAQQAVKHARFDSRAHRLLAACYARRGQLKKAEASYAKAYELDNEDLDARLGYANAMRDQGAKTSGEAASMLLAKAVPMYLSTMREQPKNPQTMFEYGRALELQGDLRGALALYESAAELDAKDVRPHLKMIAAYLSPSNLDVAAAQTSLKRARSIELTSGRSVPEVRFWEARVAFAAGQRREARSAMRRAVEGAPTDPLYQFWMGKVLEMNDELFEAVTHYERAVKLNSRYAEAIRSLGRTARLRKLFTKARMYFQRYRKAAPDDHTIFIDIGDSYTEQNRDSEAEKAYRTALKKMPNNAKALLQIGKIVDRRGRTKAALRFYQKAAKADPNLGEAVCKAALAAAQVRVTLQSRTSLENCVRLKNSPSDLKTMAEEALAGRQ